MMQVHRKAAPLQLRLGGNYIKDPQKLLNDILSKGCKDGKSLIRICTGPEPYIQEHEEYLSVYLPGFLQQRTTDTPAEAPAQQSRSRRRRRRAEAEAAATPLAPAAPPAPPAPAEPAERPRRRRKAKVEAESAAIEVTQPALAVLSEEEQKKLQGEVGKKLQKLDGLPSDQSTCEMLSEFTVCMLVARKTPQEVETELGSFLGQEYAAKVAAWFLKHVKHRYEAAAIAAGWKKKTG